MKDFMQDIITPAERTGKGHPLAKDTLSTRIATAVFAAVAAGMFVALIVYNASRGNFS